MDWLAVTAQAAPTTPALIFDGQTWSYQQLNQDVQTLAHWLTQHGVSPGQHIGVLMPNQPEYVAIIHALMRIGAVLIPFNLRLTPAELNEQIKIADCTRLFYSDATESTAQQLDIPAHKVPRLDTLAPTAQISARPIDLTAPQAIVFTSGTSGKPKGAILSYQNHFYGAMASAYRIGTLPTDHWLLCLPLYHVGGLNIVMRCCLYGTTIILHNGFNTEAVRDALQTQPVSLVSLVPTMLYRLLESPLNAPHLRLILLGGAAATEPLIARCIAANIPVATTYGLTEADSQVATQTPHMTLQKPASVGKAIPFTSIAIIQEDGTPAPPHAVGEIVVTGQTIMSGYYGNPHATDQTLRDGILHTGDLGYIDDDGDLWIVQRRSDLIITGGENVYPSEVEATLKTHPAIADAAVVGIPNPEWGQQVAAVIVLRADAALTTEAITQFCRHSLAGYKVPRHIHFTDALPLTASGKIERKALINFFSSD